MIYTFRYDKRPWTDFFARRVVTTSTGCVEFTGARDPNGYGRVSFNGTCRLAHRVSWELVTGAPPAGHVCHRCDNPPCVNPDHLWLGDDASNHGDMVVKGRSARGQRHSQAKLTDADVLAIRAAAADGVNRRELASRFGVNADHVSRLVRGARWGHL